MADGVPIKEWRPHEWTTPRSHLLTFVGGTFARAGIVALLAAGASALFTLYYAVVGLVGPDPCEGSDGHCLGPMFPITIGGVGVVLFGLVGLGLFHLGRGLLQRSVHAYRRTIAVSSGIGLLIMYFAYDTEYDLRRILVRYGFAAAIPAVLLLFPQVREDIAAHGVPERVRRPGRPGTGPG
jgi:hypothetical protein